MAVTLFHHHMRRMVYLESFQILQNQAKSACVL